MMRSKKKRLSSFRRMCENNKKDILENIIEDPTEGKYENESITHNS